LANPTRWRIPDILDLEYLLALDEAEAENSGHPALRLRDRDLFVNRIAPALSPSDMGSRRRIIRAWLELRRPLETSAGDLPAALPGQVFVEIHRLSSWLLAGGGLLAGAGLALSFLDYRGVQPLNVSIYLLTLVFSQMALFLLLILAGALRKLGWLNPNGILLYPLMGRLTSYLITALKGRVIGGLRGHQRTAFQHILGLVKGRTRVYGSLFFWPLFTLTQIFGVGFNLGVLAATVMKVTGTDIAFGWQSTLQIGPEVVHGLVAAMARPWSWIIPAGLAHPNMGEIAGSHMILKDGIYRLATSDLVSWWPFLCLSVAFYGLIPRILMLVFGILGRNSRLRRTPFDHDVCDRLYRRMTTPELITQGRRAPADNRPRLHPEPDPDCASGAAANPGAASLIALIPDDIFDACPMDDMNAAAFRIFGNHPSKTLRISLDSVSPKAVLSDIAETRSPDGNTRILLVQEAWQPPITETLNLIKHLRRHIGGTAPIHVGLIGRPEPDTIFTPVSPQDHSIWRQKLAALGDPYLHLERLTIHESPPHS